MASAMERACACLPTPSDSKKALYATASFCVPVRRLANCGVWRCLSFLYESRKSEWRFSAVQLRQAAACGARM